MNTDYLCATARRMIPPSRMPAHAVAAAVTKAGGSNLWAVGRSLGPRKRRLFESSYAVMRLIDDMVDVDFLPRPAGERAELRQSALASVDGWLTLSHQALAGDRCDETLACAPLFHALADAAGREGSDMPPEPWTTLAAAMARDVREMPLESRADFLDYCEGATVAPAAVFLYVLHARETDVGGLFAHVAAETLFDQARDMGIFCYLTHILRDLAQDCLNGGGQLLTLPREWLVRCDLSPETTPDAVANRDTRADALAQLLLAEGAASRRRATAAMDDVSRNLAARERQILAALLRIYGGIHDRLAAEPWRALGTASAAAAADADGADTARERARADVLRAHGLA